MRLRNKKTGEIVDVWSFYDGIETINLKYFTDDGSVCIEYRTLAGLNEDWEDWEDCTPEPLIKNFNIRNIVRNWAKQNNYDHVYYDRAYNRLADDPDFVHCIEFITDPLPDAESERGYTITELCGEEE